AGPGGDGEGIGVTPPRRWAARVGHPTQCTEGHVRQDQAMLLRVQHETKLSYSEPVSETVFEVRMAPPSDEDQTNLGYHLRTVPSVPVTIYRDGFGNRVDLFNILRSYRELTMRATSIVRTHRGAIAEERMAGVACDLQHEDFRTAATVEYLQSSPLVKSCPKLDEFLASLPRPEGLLVD